MKNYLLIAVLLLALPCAAQKNLMKELTGKGVVKEALGKNAGSKVLKNARVVQGKILPGGKKAPSKLNVELDRYIFNNVSPTNITKLPILLYHPSNKQQTEAILLYVRVMDDFRSFKQEMDILLYYQAKPSERRILSAAERAQLMDKISLMNSKLMKLKNIIAPMDPAYKAAREYMVYAAETVNPMLRGMLSSQGQLLRSDRTYVMSEFFLHTPKGNKDSVFLNFMTPSARAAQIARRLPSGLKMAVLNDRGSILKEMQKLNKTIFCPDWSISSYENTEKLLRDINAGAKFDLILTDILVPGGGGYYLTDTLRSQKFSGIIIALSSYEEEEGLGLAMFKRGFDGMISMPIGFEKGSGWPQEIMKKLQNYFYYRNLNHWKR